MPVPPKGLMGVMGSEANRRGLEDAMRGDGNTEKGSSGVANQYRVVKQPCTPSASRAVCTLEGSIRAKE